jgi:hypothetical protein
VLFAPTTFAFVRRGRMFKFTSKPVQITEAYVLCEDGSIWDWNRNIKIWEKVAEWEAPVKKERVVKGKTPYGYSEEFEDAWKIWCDNIKNSSNKRSSYSSWYNLNVQDRKNFLLSIKSYSKTADEHKYLKRCESYINQRHWESVKVFEEIATSTIPPLTDKVWLTNIFNQETGIVEKAKIQINSFGMSIEKAWELINEKEIWCR